MIVQYYFNFSVGKSTHLINIYSTYTEESGLDYFLETYENTRISGIVEFLKKKNIPKIQLSELKDLMKTRGSGIITEEGYYFKY